jgi:hypothetical protein
LKILVGCSVNSIFARLEVFKYWCVLLLMGCVLSLVGSYKRPLWWVSLFTLALY